MRGIGNMFVLNLALAGCALQTPPTRTEVVQQALPEGTHIAPAWGAEAGSGAVGDDWLQSFGDPVLDAIVAEGIANNPDLRQAGERVAIARQSLVVVGAQLLPQINGQLGAKQTHDFGHESDVGHTYSHTVVSLGMAWELDIWGRLRARRAAAAAGYEATALDYAYARQSLAATLATSWYLTTEANQLLALAERSVDLFGRLLDLAKIRRSAGRTSELDVADARAALETAQSNLEAARNNYDVARRTLEVLLGRYPAAEIQVATRYPSLPPAPGAGVPSSLLERRPDIVAAERQGGAAFRREEAARLALLPDFSIALTGERLGSHLVRQLQLSPWLASAAIGMTVPIYEGGALRAQVRIATAQQAQAVARYGSVVLAAFNEVENALAAGQVLDRRLQYEQRALEDRTSAVRIATAQYQAGSKDLLWVERLQAEQLAAEQRVIKLRNARIANRIQLHLALGGSFDASPSVAELSGGQ